MMNLGRVIKAMGWAMMLLPVGLIAQEAGKSGDSTASGSGGIYKTVDENGRVVFTDDPRGRDVEKVEVRSTNTQPAVALPSQTTTGKNENENKPYEPEVVITSPVNNFTVVPGQMTLNVSASILPPLRSGDGVELRMDGAAIGGWQRQAFWLLDGLYRGSHTLQAFVYDREGNEVGRSKPVIVHVKRPIVKKPPPKQSKP